MLKHPLPISLLYPGSGHGSSWWHAAACGDRGRDHPERGGTDPGAPRHAGAGGTAPANSSDTDSAGRSGHGEDLSTHKLCVVHCGMIVM